MVPTAYRGRRRGATMCTVATYARRERRWTVLSAVMVPLLLAAACSPGLGASDKRADGTGTAPVVKKTRHLIRPQPEIVISPANGSMNVRPGEGIRVRIPHGTIEHVSVSPGSDAVGGYFGPGRSTWHSRWALGVSQRYTVAVTALDSSGQLVSARSSFTTLTPRQTFEVEIFEGYLQTYGVGMPIELDFSRPITNEAAVERSLQISTSRRVVGAWYWNGDEQVDFRPRVYWPADTRVSFTGHFDGVEGAPGVYGFHTLTQTFFIGRSLIVVANSATHYMDVYYGGRLLYHWPISTGRPSLPTPDGTYLTMDKANPQLMVGPGYSLEVPWSVRITLSGDFLHDAYWSIYEQGYTNVSHGCVNMPPADAEIYYNMAVPGDPVTITGSPLAGTWGNGWTEWFLSWRQLLTGSALHKAVVAGPYGSSFVDRAKLRPFRASAPTLTAAPDNAVAA